MLIEIEYMNKNIFVNTLMVSEELWAWLQTYQTPRLFYKLTTVLKEQYQTVCPS